MAATWRVFESDSGWKANNSTDLIGPVKAFHQVTGAGNMAIAAQVPIDTNPERAGVDEDYLFVFIILGSEQRCTIIEKSQSKELATQWFHKVNDRTDQAVPMSATEQSMLDIIREPVVEHAEFIKTWTKGEQIRETPPTTASSVPAVPYIGIQRPDSLPAPKGAPKAYSPRRATEAPKPPPPIARVLQSKRQRTRSPAPKLIKLQSEQILQKAGEFINQSEPFIRSLPDPLNKQKKKR